MTKKKSNNIGSDGKNDEGDYVILLKVDFHCDGCTKRLRKTILSFPGVHTVKFEGENKVKVFALKNVDAMELRESVEWKMKKMVELIPPKKEDGNNKKSGDEKPKEPPVGIVMLKIPYHCNGCGGRIHKAISSYKGVCEVKIDKTKDLILVKGKVDAKKMVVDLIKKLKKPVEIVPEKKEKETKEGGGNKKEEVAHGGGKNAENTRMIDYYVSWPAYGYANGYGQSHAGYGNGYSYGPSHAGYGNGYGYGPSHAGYGYGYGYGPSTVMQVFDTPRPQLFTDDNPTGCSIM